MKLKAFILFAVAATITISCKKEEETPKVIYDASTQKGSEVPKIDTVSIEVADLPVHIPGTQYLIHPVGKLSLRSDYKSSNTYSGEVGSNAPSNISNYRDFEITGMLSNLKFQKIGQDSVYALSEKPVYIQTATFLKSVADKTKQQFLVYTLEDEDTNRDGQLNEKDIKALYISNSDGSNFEKLTAPFHELIDWKLIEETNTIYFRTAEDSNKNGKFDVEDKIHYNLLKLPGKAGDVKSYKIQ